MKFEPKDPPRTFVAGYENKVTIRDCGALRLEPDEQVTFHTAAGGEFDVARKSWGFYATPSLNARLKSFQLRAVLVRNRDYRYFVLLVERGHEAEFEAYVAAEPLTILCWLDEKENLERIEALFSGGNA